MEGEGEYMSAGLESVRMGLRRGSARRRRVEERKVVEEERVVEVVRRGVPPGDLRTNRSQRSISYDPPTSSFLSPNASSFEADPSQLYASVHADSYEEWYSHSCEHEPGTKVD